MKRCFVRVNGAGGWHDVRMAVKADCRHYVMRSTPSGEKTERCRVDANEDLPFACPEDCLFYEPRSVSGTGWVNR